MNLALCRKEVREFLEKHLFDDATSLILKGSPFVDITAQELVQQLVGLQKSKSKLPSWFEAEGILFPPKVNLEQTSSQETAHYKAQLIQGEHIIDITGGFGVDCAAFSEKFETVTHCELNTELSMLVKHNAQILNLENLACHNTNGIEFLKNSSKRYDVIYVDPSRRDTAGGKVFRLEDCEPNVSEHLDLLLKKCDTLLMKTSPLLDITAGLRALRNVKEIHIIAVNNDVKELLWFLTAESKVDDVKICSVNLRGNQSETFESSINTEKSETATYSEPLTYLYEPNAAIMKSGSFASVSQILNLAKLHPSSHLYTSKNLIEFPGRRFEVLEVIPFSKSTLKKKFKGFKANITTRNFPWSVAKLKQQLQIKDGGETYLFFTTLQHGEKVCIACKKASA